MLHGHCEAQQLFHAVGKRLGYDSRRTFTREFPTDGCWLIRSPTVIDGGLPFTALEVVVSESAKTVRGSVVTLEAVSPSLAILLIQEEEIRRRVIRTGGSSAEADALVTRLREKALELSDRSRQRFQVWSMARMRFAYSTVIGSALKIGLQYG
jgi:hypothetical protein